MKLHAWTSFLFALTVVNAHGASKSLAKISLEKSSQLPEISLKLEVEKYKLKNGLTVLLHEDHSAPIVSYQTWFRVGSKDEKPGITGIAHFLEHLMFKGAKRYTGKLFDKLMQANGITNNAFTSLDYTGYYENLPSSKLELIVDMESDRMENLALRKQDFKSEREVVKEERRSRVDNSPVGKMSEVTYHTIFKVAPYRWPVIGWMRDLNSINIKNVRNFWKRFYAPNNAVLVIAGDIDKKRVKKLVEKYYGHISSSTKITRNYAKEPRQSGQRNVVIRKNIKSPYFSIAYKIPGSGKEDVFALDLLASILGHGHSSRLYKRLVYKEQSAGEIGVSSYTPKEAGIFRISGSIPVSDKSNQKLEKAIKGVFAEILRVSQQKVSEKELLKAKNRLMKTYVDSLTTISGKAEVLALNEIIFNSYQVFFTDLQRYNSVSLEKIREVARKYLKPSRRSVIRLLPKKKEVL